MSSGMSPRTFTISATRKRCSRVVTSRIDLNSAPGRAAIRFSSDIGAAWRASSGFPVNPLAGVRQLRRGQPIEGSVGIALDDEHRAMRGSDKALSHRVVEKTGEALEIAVHV